MDRRHKVGAWLSLFAMLMIFVGPLIGQGAALAHGTGHSMPMSMGDMNCADMPGMSHGSASSNPAGKHHGMVIWEKCGYCSLLFQHPALVESTTFFLPLGVPAPSYLSAALVSRQAAAPVFPGARTRAPPV
ncbi:DUF2946 domain-containing protein [Pseudomonas luteola]|uniref:DUF2946 domain-containing protein n=1 Tax=Pseudomonas luteola TaxID=47886 RepID=UPI003A835131